ncbi:MAG: hypothetical protein NVSMB44_47250 [Ktedonobacteraceae bacterium]
MEALEFLALVVPFLILVYFAFLLFIRPPRKVFWISLLAGLIVGVVNFIGDKVAYQMHWWHYQFSPVALQRGAAPLQVLVADLFTQSMASLHVPLAFYLSTILIFGSLAFLLIWRFWDSRSRWLALLLLIGTPIFCIVRDILGGLQKTSYQVWENTSAATILTVAMWLVGFYLGFWLFWRMIAGIKYTRYDAGDAAGQRAPEQKTTQPTR